MDKGFMFGQYTNCVSLETGINAFNLDLITAYISLIPNSLHLGSSGIFYGTALI